MNFLRPFKSDINQITSLVKLGCNDSDICLVLNITSQKLNKWKAKSKVVEDLLKPKARPEFTLTHPDFAPMVEEAFTCAGKRFYRFKEEYRNATGRYKYYYATLRELELKLSLEKLQEFVDAFKLVLNGGGKKKSIELTDLHKLVINMESRIVLAFDPATVKKLASVAYFDETEDLTAFDEKYGREKVNLWVSHGVHDFFLTRPIGELFGVKNTSEEYLPEYLKQMETMGGIIADLNSNLLTVSEGNS